MSSSQTFASGIASASLLLGLLVPTADGVQIAKLNKPKFTIGKDTTYVTGPVDKDGFIDYVTALNQRLGKGIQPADNAAALLCQVLGPRPEKMTISPRFYRLLGIAEPPEKGDYFQRLHDFAEKKFQLKPGKELDALFDELEAAYQRAWTVKEFPRLAAWLKANQTALSVAAEAVQRKQYFYPRVPSGSAPSLVNSLLPHVQGFRELATALTARALLHTGERRLDDAWNDLLNCHRLARHVGSGGTLIENLVGIAIEAIASDADVTHLNAAPFSAAQLKKRLADLQNLPPMLSMADSADTTERFAVLDSIMMLQRFGSKGMELMSGFKKGKPPPTTVPNDMSGIEWDPALRNLNKWFDRIVATLREKDLALRKIKMQLLDNEVKTLKANLAKMGLLEKFFLSPTERGKRICDVLIVTLTPAFHKVREAGDRIEQVERNLHVAFALAAYRAEHKAYPKTLAALAPNYLKEVPPDLFTGKPLIYRPSENGFHLYSVGPNGKDENGQGREDDPSGDDIGIRLPLPKLKKN